MQILSVELNNFQVHKELLVEFSPTITTIKGPTDKGKSAILRALRWVFLNDLTGDGFIREGAKKAVVAVKVDCPDMEWEGWISRVKGTGGSINTYVMEEEEYKSFGQGVPSDIARTLRVNEINFQGQHDSPFWFAETGGEVSRRLNAVIDLTVIDTALSNIASEVRRAQERKSICEERLADLKKELEEIEPQRSRITDFEILKEEHEQFTQATENHDRMVALLGKIRACRRSELEDQAREAESLLALAQESIKLSRRENELDGVLISIKQYQSRSEPPPDFLPVETAHQEWDNIEEGYSVLQDLISEIDRLTHIANMRAISYQEIEKRFHKKMKGQACPLCGNKIQ